MDNVFYIINDNKVELSNGKEYSLVDFIDILVNYINQLETNRDELKKWLEEFQEDICYDTDGEYFCKDENVEIKVQDVLDKMQELERGKE